jgi:hypothetical protein
MRNLIENIAAMTNSITTEQAIDALKGSIKDLMQLVWLFAGLMLHICSDDYSLKLIGGFTTFGVFVSVWIGVVLKLSQFFGKAQKQKNDDKSNE